MQVIAKNKVIMRWLAHRVAHWILKNSRPPIPASPSLFPSLWVLILQPYWPRHTDTGLSV